MQKRKQAIGTGADLHGVTQEVFRNNKTRMELVKSQHQQNIYFPIILRLIQNTLSIYTIKPAQTVASRMFWTNATVFCSCCKSKLSALALAQVT